MEYTYNKKIYRYDGNKLYEYIHFEVDDKDNHILQLEDMMKKKKGSASDFECYEFKLKQKSQAKIYNVDDDVKVYISPIGIRVTSFRELKEIEVNAFYANGISKRLMLGKVDGEKSMFGVEKTKKTQAPDEELPFCRYINIFDELMDVNNIDYITYNGDRY